MRTILLAAAVLALASTGFGATYYVPDNFGSIQGAISSASVKDGDIVIVRAGTYLENLDFQGKEITVRSEDGAMATVIDAHMNGTGVLFDDMEGPGAVLDGFTVTNGSGHAC